MPKASQTPSKAKSSTKAEAKPKNMKPKSKKRASHQGHPHPHLPTPTPAPSPSISSTIPTSSSPVPAGESVPVITDQVQHPPSKLDILVSVVDVAPLDTLPPTVRSHKRRNSLWTEDEKDDGSEKEEEVVNSHEEHDAQNIAIEEEKKEKNHGEEEDDFESEGEDQEKVSESEGGYEESEKEDGNVSEESEGSMTIGNSVIAPSEETGEETRAQELGSLLTTFTVDEEVSSDKDDIPLSEVGKKPIKTPMKATKLAVPTRKEVAPLARTHLTRSKRKVVDAQIIKESRSAKKPKKKRKGTKVTKPATPYARDNKGKTRKNVPAAVDRITEFRNGKVLNGKILVNTDEKGIAQLVEKFELQGWKHMFVKAFPHFLRAKVLTDFFDNVLTLFFLSFTFFEQMASKKSKSPTNPKAPNFQLCPFSLGITEGTGSEGNFAADVVGEERQEHREQQGVDQVLSTMAVDFSPAAEPQQLLVTEQQEEQAKG
ncbi:PREDICTED: proline-, glutamic acid- and leucine-rich protein 1-like [Nicotiana attenuata]|uniref:proline-, glutamic acid- and leucine-rich protein 1-like n=1 Tax=Nicotiana attenuata TaxID=49451 RepID=UPI000904E2EB|nr:PREDICTED: proline-, glutamic acid- and leucine-rich protein 1-like [Nicotiana attenuata]